VDGDDMLRQANELRAERRWAESLALYESIMRTFPGTPQAYSGGVSAAYLRLDHMGDARGALVLFQSLARRGGALSEEIDWGLTRAYRALGDVPEEAKALEAFAANHPDSPRIDAARARLSEIQ
jgi:regulator of sirC expression with transglutaminase-like and TPR domain